MAQSKKKLAKQIDRACRHLHPRVRLLAAQQRRHDLLDTFELLWGEAYDLLRHMQRGYPASLQRSASAPLPVTYQQVERLYERLQTFKKRLPATEALSL